MIKLGENWWLVHEEHGHIGPYNTRKEASEDREGLKAYEKYKEVPGFVTMEDDLHHLG